MTTEKTYIGEQPDAARYFVPVEMDRPRVLAFDSAATFLVYQRFGDNFIHELYETDPHAPVPDKGKPGRIRLRSHDAFVYFLWAALQRDARAAGEKLSIEDVAEQIVPMAINDLAASLFVALAATRRPPPPKSEHAPKNA